jgi:hypothetical protein
MAASDAVPFPVKGRAYRITFPILDADGDLVTGAASLDSEVSKDGAAFTDCSNEATEIATASGVYYLDLTAAEMTANTVAVIIKTGTAGAKTTLIVLNPVTIPEPGAVPAWGATSIEEALAWLVAMHRNALTTTASVMSLRNDAQSANLATAALTDDGSTFQRGEWA